MTAAQDSTTLLQLALDDITREEIFPLLEQVADVVDIVEVGTPLLMRYGISIITDIKQRHPRLQLLSDTKIMDAAYYEAAMSFDAGADIVTIIALTDDGSVEEAVRAATERGKKVMADMICVPNQADRARTLATLGVDVLAVHTGVDQQAQGRTPLDDLRDLTSAGTNADLAVAGGISRHTVHQYLEQGPRIIIVGSGITGSARPADEASHLRMLINGATR